MTDRITDERLAWFVRIYADHDAGVAAPAAVEILGALIAERAEVERLEARWISAANAECATFVVKVFGISKEDLEECGLAYSVSETLERLLCEACDKACEQWKLGAYGEDDGT
jgi:hypothetical protein